MASLVRSGEPSEPPPTHSPSQLPIKGQCTFLSSLSGRRVEEPTRWWFSGGGASAGEEPARERSQRGGGASAGEEPAWGRSQRGGGASTVAVPVGGGFHTCIPVQSTEEWDYLSGQRQPVPPATGSCCLSDVPWSLKPTRTHTHSSLPGFSLPTSTPSPRQESKSRRLSFQTRR